MRRADYLTGWDDSAGERINVAKMSAHELAVKGINRDHEIGLFGTDDDVQVIARGLHALIAQAHLQEALTGKQVPTYTFERILGEITARHAVEEGLPPFIPSVPSNL